MNLRNVAIIAHVDHGKTTLVDQLLQQSGSFREQPARRRARARLATTWSASAASPSWPKRTSVVWKDTRINIVDTPGHADFGGEVERILNMVDGAIVLVDAAEGPLPQTKFVVAKALKVGLKPDRRHQQGRPPGRPRPTKSPTRCSTCSPRSTPPTSSSISRCCTARPSRAGWPTTPDGPQGPAWRRCSISSSATSRRRWSRTARSACSARSWRPTPISAASSPAASRPGSVKPNQPVKVLDRDGDLIEDGPRHQGAGLPRPGARADRRGRGRRHRRHRRPARGDRVAHALRARGDRRRCRRSRSIRRRWP